MARKTNDERVMRTEASSWAFWVEATLLVLLSVVALIGVALFSL